MSGSGEAVKETRWNLLADGLASGRSGRYSVKDSVLRMVEIFFLNNPGELTKKNFC